MRCFSACIKKPGQFVSRLAACGGSVKSTAVNRGGRVAAQRGDCNHSNSDSVVFDLVMFSPLTLVHCRSVRGPRFGGARFRNGTSGEAGIGTTSRDVTVSCKFYRGILRKETTSEKVERVGVESVIKKAKAQDIEVPFDFPTVPLPLSEETWKSKNDIDEIRITCIYLQGHHRRHRYHQQRPWF